MKATLIPALVASALVFSTSLEANQIDCLKVAALATKQVTANPDDTLKIVERLTAANPSCACEVVKAAILEAEADRKLVAQIVAAAIEAAPDKTSLVTSCAVAVAPDALMEIKAVLAKLTPKALPTKGNDPVANGSKGGKEVIVKEEVKNPLDGPYLIPGLPPIHPPIVPVLSSPSSSDITVGDSTGTITAPTFK